ncbi:hypothetical protein AHiyo6_17130 [Arthrobacter sp. Hiyo6]|nr:hypothetical protein AHiyo6_17130 [Arthrobacter sp. Hiyo6]
MDLAISSRTLGFITFKSGWCLENMWRYHSPLGLSWVQMEVSSPGNTTWSEVSGGVSFRQT